MMTKITIAEVVKGKSGTNKNGPWQQVTVVDANGLKFSSFDAGLLALPTGTNIEIENEKKDNYNNITAWHIVEGPVIPPPAKPTPPTPDFTRQPISGPEHGMAMNNIMNAWIAGKFLDTNPLVLETL